MPLLRHQLNPYMCVIVIILDLERIGGPVYAEIEQPSQLTSLSGLLVVRLMMKHEGNAYPDGVPS